jgi:hypothetical protein
LQGQGRVISKRTARRQLPGYSKGLSPDLIQ